MDLPLVVIAALVAVGAFVLRERVSRKARERAEREPQVPTMPKIVGSAIMGAVFIAVGIAILVTAEDPTAGTGSGRLEWLPAWIQTLLLVAGGVYFIVLAARSLRALRARQRRGVDAPAFDPLARDTDVTDDSRP